MSFNNTKILIVLYSTLIACSVTTANEYTEATRSEVAVSNPPEPLNHYEILFIGNSHSSYHGLPDLVSTLIEAGSANTTAVSDLAPGWAFLADRLNDPATLNALNSRPWTHVVLQAQKYSTTGLYSYPTDAAEEWIRRVKARNALPVLFPEWPRKGNTEEGPRIHQLHLEIASRESACVAPIGLAWEAAIERYPGITLHAPDGNHSNPTGALLTAYVLYQVISLQDASKLPYLPDIAISAPVQQNLREIAAHVVNQNEAACSGPRIEFDPEEIEFNVSVSGASSIQSITVRSSGMIPVTIQSITGPDDPFFLDQGSCNDLPITLKPAESCTLEVSFEPRYEGLFLDSVAIYSNDPDSPGWVDLSGFNGVVVPALNRWGLLLLTLLVAGSVAILRK